MSAATFRLVLASVLFAGWVGGLAYLVFARADVPPDVLSRPQFLVAPLVVVAQVDGTERDQPVAVETVHWPQKEDAARLEGQTIVVTNLADCRGPSDADPPDWVGPRTYILALEATGDADRYRVVGTPLSPGFGPFRGKPGPPRIYPATPQTLAQLRQIKQ